MQYLILLHEKINYRLTSKYAINVEILNSIKRNQALIPIKSRLALCK
jgi:hypothetical protein